jgi:hypothetical protein
MPGTGRQNESGSLRRECVKMVQVGGEEQGNIPESGRDAAAASGKGHRRIRNQGEGRDVLPFSHSPVYTTLTFV